MAAKFASNIIPTKNWIGSWNFLTRSLRLSIILLLLFFSGVRAQALSSSLDPSYGYGPSFSSSDNGSFLQDTTGDRVQVPDSLPSPRSVALKSLMIPGWGQIVNKQAWKIPIIYGLLGGLTYYSSFLTKQYHDYRAAYYNQNDQIEGNEDMRFGPTPPRLEGADIENLKFNRDTFHNRRDFIYITIALAYGLNAIDAFVFAHMRSFDVSEDLSVRTTVKPSVIEQGKPGVTLSFELFTRSKAR